MKLKMTVALAKMVLNIFCPKVSLVGKMAIFAPIWGRKSVAALK